MSEQGAGDQVVDRMVRVIGRHRSPTPTGAMLLGSLGIFAVAAGSWWTAQAVVDGRSGALLLRVALTVGVGIYYWLLSLAVRGPLA